MQTYRDLLVWQKGIELCESIYVISREFPREELYGLTTQIRRAAVSVPSNIAEGSGRTTRGEFVQSVGHCRGSLFEVETQLLVAQRVSYLCKEQIQPLLVLTDEIGRLSSGLIRSLLVPTSTSTNTSTNTNTQLRLSRGTPLHTYQQLFPNRTVLPHATLVAASITVSRDPLEVRASLKSRPHDLLWKSNSRLHRNRRILSTTGYRRQPLPTRI